MKLDKILKKVLCFGAIVAILLSVLPKSTVSAEGYPTVDMFEHVKALYGSNSFKGVQGAWDSDQYSYTDSNERPHGLSHSFWNAYLEEMIFLKPVDGAKEFSFEGKTYWFDFSSIEAFIQMCNSQLMTCNLQFMLRWDGSDETAWLVDPKARVANPPDAPEVAAHKMYAMDTAGEGRQAIRAYWRALMEWCVEKGYHIDQLILGNEVNAPNTWHYFGTLDVNTCTEKYAISYLDMYEAVREYTDVSRCSICIDHSWTFDHIGTAIPVKTFLDSFYAKVIKLKGSDVDWCISSHLWPADMLKPASTWTNFPGWPARYCYQKDDTYFFDASNLHIMTDYVREKFGTQHRIMMTEQGFVSDQGEDVQAASLAYAYYACLYDTMVDQFMIFNQNADGMNAALLPLAEEVYQKIGSPDEADKQRIAEICLPVIGVSSWEEIIPNFGGPVSILPMPTLAPTPSPTPEPTPEPTPVPAPAITEAPDNLNVPDGSGDDGDGVSMVVIVIGVIVAVGAGIGGAAFAVGRITRRK